jgi:stress-induced morphogen
MNGSSVNQFVYLGGCGSFFAIKIASDAFKGLSTVKQHKLVTEVLKQEIHGIHGLQVSPGRNELHNC